MKEYHLSGGIGRLKIELSAEYVGEGLLVRIYNEYAHIGAVAVGDYDHKEKRAFSSVITLPGHRDDEVAKKQAHRIARHTMKPVCVVAGIHLDNITVEEIIRFQAEADKLVQSFLNGLSPAR